MQLQLDFITKFAKITHISFSFHRVVRLEIEGKKG